jgi:hypothetical protein
MEVAVVIFLEIKGNIRTFANTKTAQYFKYQLSAHIYR